MINCQILPISKVILNLKPIKLLKVNSKNHLSNKINMLIVYIYNTNIDDDPQFN